jgi:SAM-dependent methyltransferase
MAPMGMRRYVRPMMNSVRKVFPSGYFFALYNNASKRISAQAGERDRAFAAFLSRSEGKHCLQISVKDEIGHKFGSNWVSVDKYDDRAFIDRHDDVENLEFPDGSFDAAVCWSVLEHVPHPDRAIAELLRVLKPGGEIWVQLPFLFPYHESPRDYWRVTPDGLRLWMSDFDEIACACDYWAGTKLVAATYFYGTKASRLEGSPGETS